MTTTTTPCPLHRRRHQVDLSLGRLAGLVEANTGISRREALALLQEIEAGLIRASDPRLKPVWRTVELIAGTDEIMLRTAEWRARVQMEGRR